MDAIILIIVLALFFGAVFMIKKYNKKTANKKGGAGYVNNEGPETDENQEEAY
jgi:hypothetical protein